MPTITILSGRISDAEQSTALAALTSEQHFLQAMAAAAVQLLFEIGKASGHKITAVSYQSQLLVSPTQPQAPRQCGGSSSPSKSSSEYLVEENFVIEGDIAAAEIAIVGMAMGLQRRLNLPFIKVNFRPTFNKHPQR